MFALALIETRVDHNIDTKINEHAKYLPENWHQIAVVSDRNRYCTKKGTGLISNINSLNDYNRILTRAKFWENFLDYDRVLICQMDSGLLREGIEEFLEWDYVGAPWKFQRHGGNGGLSIRNPKVMHEICCTHVWTPGMAYEDVWFCNIMYGKHNLAPRVICEKFSVETIFQLGTLGYHNIEGYLTRREVKEIREQYLK